MTTCAAPRPIPCATASWVHATDASRALFAEAGSRPATWWLRSPNDDWAYRSLSEADAPYDAVEAAAREANAHTFIAGSWSIEHRA